MERKRGKRYRKGRRQEMSRNISIETVTEEPNDANFEEVKFESNFEGKRENLKARRISSISELSKRLPLEKTGYCETEYCDTRKKGFENSI